MENNTQFTEKNVIFEWGNLKIALSVNEFLFKIIERLSMTIVILALIIATLFVYTNESNKHIEKQVESLLKSTIPFNQNLLYEVNYETKLITVTVLDLSKYNAESYQEINKYLREKYNEFKINIVDYKRLYYER